MVIQRAALIIIAFLLIIGCEGESDKKSVELSKPASVAKSEGLAWQFGYDKAGRITKLVDPAGQATTLRYEHDEKNRLQRVVTRTPDSSEVAREFDSFGRLVTLTDGQGRARYTYDDYSHLTSVQRDGSPAISYTYDSMDRVSSVTVGKRFTLHYIYDFLGRLAKIKTPVGDISYDYQKGQGQVHRTLPNGLRSVWDYEFNGRLVSITHVAPDNSILMQFSYQYRPDGLIEKIEEYSFGRQRQISYEYDNLERLTAVNDSNGEAVQYRYDKLGNRTELAASEGTPVASRYDWAGRLINHAGEEVTHDQAGNLFSHRGPNGSLEYSYSGLHALKTAATEGGVVTYQYDGDGNLTERTINGHTSRYVPDPFAETWRPLSVTNSTGEEIYYIWDGDYLLASIVDDEAQFYLHDHVGSIRGFGKNAEQIQVQEYAPFGRPEDLMNQDGLHPGFAGLFFDSQAAVYLTRGRAYSPELGRFLQIDPEHRLPYGSQNDLSPYVYAGNDPINFVDRSGLSRTCLNPGCGSVSDSIRTWELERAAERGMKYRSHLFDDAKKDIGNFVQAQLQPYVDKAAGDSHTLKAIINDRLESGFDQRLNGKTVIKGIVRDLYENSLIPDIQIGGVTIRTIQNFLNDEILVKNYGDWINKTDRWFNRFGGIAQTRANYFRGLQSGVLSQKYSRKYGRPIQMDLGKGFRATQNTRLASGVFRGVTHALGSFAEAAEVGFKYLRITGTAMMAMNSPIYLNRRTQLGSEGYGSASIAGGTFKWAETLSTGADRWWKQGNILRNHVDVLKTDFGEYRRAITEYTPGANMGERFMMHNFPLGSYYDHGKTSIRKVTTSHERYREVTRGGIKQIIPISKPQPLQPSNVGGVYLRGAGEVLKHLGSLKGVAVDETTGRLVLLSEDKGDLSLPSLRMDDMITIFRCVYEHGQAPFVSIDPNPKDPEGPIMFVRHGPCTEGTYVGWILFETDRIMKGYSLGFDNNVADTDQPLVSSIKDYKSYFDLSFSKSNEKKLGNIWERFWIVPAEINRRRSAADKLTLFDVPLMVNTQRMVMREGKLVPAPNGKSSKPAKLFTEWFTKNYDAISAETLLTPAAECGIPTAVPVFAELQRIALIAAIAENLRDQGEPFPSWMQNMDVKACPATDLTPSGKQKTDAIWVVSKVDGKKQVLRTKPQNFSGARIYGGVRLSPADEAVHTIEEDSRAKMVAEELRKTITATPTFTKATVSQGGTQYQAITLPGDSTRALGGKRFDEIDLSVPINRGTSLNLIRSYHSFFQPTGVLGEGWVFDLPRLQKERRPVKRSEEGDIYRTVYRLTSPLHTYSASFSKEPGPKENLWASDSPSDIQGLANVKVEKQGDPTAFLYFKDGRQWSFNEDGYLIATEEGPLTRRYLRDGANRISQIGGWYGESENPLALVNFEYADDGRLIAARGSNKKTVTYSYNQDGQLIEVKRSVSNLRYEYQDNLVSKEFVDGRLSRVFNYDSQGRLLNQERLDGSDVTYKFTRNSKGEITAVREGDNESGINATIQYDPSLRPVKQVLRNGTQLDWEYQKNGDAKATLTLPTGEQFVSESLSEGRNQNLHIPEGGTFGGQYDDAGHLITLKKGNQRVLEQTWHGDGLLGSATTESHTLIPKYREDRVLKEMTIGAPEEGQGFREWVSVKLDEAGRPNELSDFTGSLQQIGYDKTGGVGLIASSRGGVAIHRDAEGKVKQVRICSGFRPGASLDANACDPETVNFTQNQEYDSKTGELRTIKLTHKLTQGASSATFNFQKGGVSSVKQFDGGEIALSHYDEDTMLGQVKKVQLPNDLVLNYDYGADNRVSAINIGDESRWEYEFDEDGRLLSLRQVPIEK